MPEVESSTALVAVNQEVIEVQIVARAEQVRQRIAEIKSDLVDRSLELGHLLVEARENCFHHVWGFATFGDWVEQESGLDMGARQAAYLMQIVTKSQELGIGDEELRKVKLSKLKEIFSLKAAEPEIIKELLVRAETETLEQIRIDVQKVKIADGAEAYTVVSYRIPLTVKENIIPLAFDAARLKYGTSNVNGEPQEISDGQCFELCLAAMLDSADHSPVEDAEFEDILEYQDAGLVG